MSIEEKDKAETSFSGRELEPLKRAVEHIAELLCEFSADRELFISGGTPSASRLDTKTLKEFSSVLKEISAVACELRGESDPMRDTVVIEFAGEAMRYSK